MVRYNTERYIGFVVFVIFYICNLANMCHNVSYRINLKKVIHVLHNGGKPFKSHTGIYIGIGKPVVVALLVFVELCKHKVPKFNIAVAVTAELAVGTSARFFNASVKIYFRARTARSCTVFPEIVLFSHSYNVRRVNADFLCPDFKGFVIVLIDGNPKLVHRHFKLFCYKLPRPGGCFMLEIVSEREVSEHFKESAVPCGVSDTLNIGCADTFLAGGYSFSRRYSRTRKIRLERCHTCVNKQKAGVVLRHKRKRREP